MVIMQGHVHMLIILIFIIYFQTLLLFIIELASLPFQLKLRYELFILLKQIIFQYVIFLLDALLFLIYAQREFYHFIMHVIFLHDFQLKLVIGLFQAYDQNATSHRAFLLSLAIIREHFLSHHLVFILELLALLFQIYAIFLNAFLLKLVIIKQFFLFILVFLLNVGIVLFQIFDLSAIFLQDVISHHVFLLRLAIISEFFLFPHVFPLKLVIRLFQFYVLIIILLLINFYVIIMAKYAQKQIIQIIPHYDGYFTKVILVDVILMLLYVHVLKACELIRLQLNELQLCGATLLNENYHVMFNSLICGDLQF